MYKDNDHLPEVFPFTLVTFSDSKLLKRYVLGTTQNQNVCKLNGVGPAPQAQPPWQQSGLVFTCISSLSLHSGASSRLRLMERLSIPGGALRFASNIKEI